MKLNTRVLMGIPTLSSSKRSVMWTDSMANLQMPLGSSMGRVWIENETIAEARNALCKAALEANVDYLFMLGDDVIAPPNTLLLLLDRIGKMYPITKRKQARISMVTGVYWTKAYPPEPYLFNGVLEGTFKDWKVGEFIPIDMAGCDCLLIETEVLKKVPFPWFSTQWVWEPGQEVSPIATEDFYFYAKVRKYGFRLFADTSIQCLHEDRYTGGMYGLTAEMEQAGGVPQIGPKEKLIADLGCGLATTPHLYGRGVKIVRFDARPEPKPDIQCDVRFIPKHHFGIYDRVYASHVLEHFRRSEAPSLIRHWVQLLKVNGVLEIHVPNVENAFKQILNPDPNLTDEQKHYVWQQIYGDQAEEGQAWEHKNGFTPHRLEMLLRSTVPELSNVLVEIEHDGWDLKATATLSKLVKHEALSEMWKEIENVESD